MTFAETAENITGSAFDYLISLTAVDWKDHFMMVYHLTSTTFRHTIVVKTRIDNRENPAVDTLSIYGKQLNFMNGKYLICSESVSGIIPICEDYFWKMIMDFPLRKDFTDESRMIVK